MTAEERKRATRRMEQILRGIGSSLTDELAKVQDVRQLPRLVREKIIDELGEEFSAKGLQPNGEPNAYGLEIEDLTDACGLANSDED
jgi:hypothetical protein